MFTKLSREKNLMRNIELDNLFVTEYMPYAPENFVKVYIAGLSLAHTPDNSIDELSILLGVEKAVIMEAFLYWAEQGIINVLPADPPEI